MPRIVHALTERESAMIERAFAEFFHSAAAATFRAKIQALAELLGLPANAQLDAARRQFIVPDDPIESGTALFPQVPEIRLPDGVPAPIPTPGKEH